MQGRVTLVSVPTPLKRNVTSITERMSTGTMIADAATSFEEVWAERGEFADELEDLKSRV